METMVSSDNLYSRTLDALEEAGNLRTLSQAEHQGKWIWKEGKRMLNLSSNDYLGLAADTALRDEFMRTLSERDFLFSSSSSRLLTGNFTYTMSWNRCLPRCSEQVVRWFFRAVIT